MSIQQFIFRCSLLGCIFLTACESSTSIDIDKVIEEKVQERLTTYRNVVDKRCLTTALNYAGGIADSVILERAKLMRDTSGRPIRPPRPGDPEWQALKDSLPLRPLFDSLFRVEVIRMDSLRQDSLQQDSLRRDSLFQLKRANQ